VEEHMVLLKEEISINVTTMDEAWEVCLKENARIFPCIIAVPMEEDQKVSSEKNSKNFNNSKESVSLTIVRGDEEMEEVTKNVPYMKRMEWHGGKCELVNHVGEIIVERRIIACDPKELILDDDLGEIEVRVTILNYPKDTAQIMTIWRWPLSRTILDGHCLSSLFIAYDEHHVLEDEGVMGVKKKSYAF
jgi:hypothetical protein